MMAPRRSVLSTKDSQTVFAVILAGGSGTRFWPKSRLKKPKQLCALGGGEKTLIEETLTRLDGMIAPEHRMIVTHSLQSELTQKIVGKAGGLILPEPTAKNTTAALILAALEIRARSGDEALMSCFHADHLIKDRLAFSNCVKAAQESARAGNIALIGITPKEPHTGFGYIERGEKIGPQDFKVASFREKPNLKTAQEFLASGRFLWNSGMFNWKVGVFLDECRRYAADSLIPLENLFKQYGRFEAISQAALKDIYLGLPSIAVDNAILEKSSRISVVEGNFEWHDVGSWSALATAYPEKLDAQSNLALGSTKLMDCKNVSAQSDGPLLVGLGLEDLILVYSEGALLVCPKDRAQDVKTIVDELKKIGREDLA